MTPWTGAHQASLSFTISWSLVKLKSIQSAMPSNHLILCRHLLLLPLIFMVMTFKPCIIIFLVNEDILTGVEYRFWYTCKWVCVCVWTFYIKIFHIRKCRNTHITDGHCTGRTEACPAEDQSPGLVSETRGNFGQWWPPRSEESEMGFPTKQGGW